MSLRTLKQLNADKKHDKVLEQHVEKKKRQVVQFSLQDENVRISGEQRSLEIVNKEDLDKITLLDLIKHLKGLGEDISETYKYVMRLDLEEEEQFLLPKMRFAFQNGEWSYEHARFQVAEYMTHLGYGGNGPKAYKLEKDEPSWFPDSLSWELFEHPSRASKDILNKVMRAIMTEFEIPESYHCQELNANGEIVSTKKKRKRKSKKQGARKDKAAAVDTSNDTDSHTEQNSNVDDSYEKLLEVVKSKKKRNRKSKKSQPDDTQKSGDDNITPPGANANAYDIFAHIDIEIDAAVNDEEESDGLEELEQLAAECGASESSESSQEA